MKTSPTIKKVLVNGAFYETIELNYCGKISKDQSGKLVQEMSESFIHNLSTCMT
jgi:hypothetical protein